MAMLLVDSPDMKSQVDFKRMWGQSPGFMTKSHTYHCNNNMVASPVRMKRHLETKKFNERVDRHGSQKEIFLLNT